MEAVRDLKKPEPRIAIYIPAYNAEKEIISVLDRIAKTYPRANRACDGKSDCVGEEQDPSDALAV